MTVEWATHTSYQGQGTFAVSLGSAVEGTSSKSSPLGTL